MKKIKRKATVVQTTALLLFFALAFSVTAAAAGLFNATGTAEGGADTPFIDLFRPGTDNGGSDDSADPPKTTVDPTNPSDPNNIVAGYVQNLSDAFHTGLIQGYTDDRAAVSISERVRLHNLLTSAIATVDGAITPVLYESYSADGYTLVKRLQLDYDYTSGVETIIQYSKQYNNQDASYLTVSTPYLVGRKTVQSYMGYLIVSRVELRQVEVTTPPAVTDEPVTEAPATDTPATSEPTTDEPVTVEPETNVPATSEPVTDLPASTEPTTEDDASVEEPFTRDAEATEPLTAEESAPETAEADAPQVPKTVEEISDELTVSSSSSASSAGTESGIVYETVEVTVLSIYDRNGKLLVDDIGTKEPYYARDYSNRPVFKDADGNLFAFDGKTFIETDKGKLRSELFYDYPAFPLGEYKSIYEAHYNTETGYYEFINYKNGKKVIDDQYLFAFNFGSEGYAVIGSEYNHVLKVINRQKRVIFNAGSNYVFYSDPNTGKRQYVRDYYYLPDTFGIESIGCSGFDNGYLRIRIKTLSKMSDALNVVVKDEYYLVNTSGEKFSIPEGYTLEGYSDGVLLLSKDGLYGYYSISGEWIAQPIYTYARPFVQGLAVVGSENGTVGMIDTAGNIVLPFVFTSIEDVSSGLIVTYCEGVGYETFELVKK